MTLFHNMWGIIEDLAVAAVDSVVALDSSAFQSPENAFDAEGTYAEVTQEFHEKKQKCWWSEMSDDELEQEEKYLLAMVP